jgi:signal peptidase II
LFAFAVAAVTVLVLDILTKWIVSHTMTLHQSVEVLGDFGRLTYIRNPGAAFGLFSGNRTSFIFISIFAIAIILWLLARRHYRGRLSLTALGMILGGAVGNLIDRIRVGEVVDFVDLGFGRTRWPVFNVADMGVTIGVCILAVALYLREGARRGAEPEADGGGAEGDPRAADPEIPREGQDGRATFPDGPA